MLRAIEMNRYLLRAATTGISTQNNGSGGAHNNTQPTIVLNYIIKA